MKSLAALLHRACDKDFCIEDATAKFRSAGVDKLSEALAAELVSSGAIHSEPVIISIGNNALDIVSLFAVWRAGLVAVPLHEAAPPDVMERMKRTVGARFVIHHGRLEGSGDRPSASPLPDDAALVIFTSGSTGQPKGVVLGHDRLAAKIEALQELLQLKADDQVIVPDRKSVV